MITKIKLEKANYKRYRSNWKDSIGYICSYQKRFDNEIGKKYFVNFDLYNFEWNEKITISSHAQMYIPKENANKDEIIFTIELFINDNSTIEDAEQFYEDMWQSMKCRHYEKWDEC